MQASPPVLSQDDKDDIVDMINLSLNRMILRALLHGLYTGIVAITLWTVFSSPKRLRSKFLGIIIITLHILSTIALGNNWTFERRGLIEYGDNYYSIYSAMEDDGPRWRADYLIDGITGGISTLLVDITIIWRCWTLWDRQWQVVSMPILCAIGSTVIKVVQMFNDIQTLTDDSPEEGQFAPEIDWSLIYIILMLATTLICTLLIIYRIVRKAREMRASRKIIEMLIQSSAMYSLSLIIYLALVSRNLEAGYYADTFVAYIKAIAPTLLVGRVLAHANASSRRQQMAAMWENHPPLVGCFRKENANNIQVCHAPDDGHQTVSGSSMGKETV